MGYNYEYPYTDMHRYNSDWILNKMLELIGDWKDMQGNYVSLHDYVRNYFKELKLEDEVSRKLTEMEKDGTLAQLVNKEIYQGYLYGKKIAVFGDSIAKGDHSEGGVFARFSRDFDVEIKNYAVNGAYMVDGVTGNLTSQIENMIIDGFKPDIILFMYHFNEISNAGASMTTANLIGFPQNNDRGTSIGNLEYWVKFIFEHYPDTKMAYINYPIKSAQNERSFFNAQFEYSLYVLCELYSIPICNMKNCGVSFDENATHYTVDGLHFNSNCVDNILYPFIKSFLLSGMEVKNECPTECIGLYGTQTDMQNYIAMLNKVANVYGKKDFARTFDGLWFYTDESTTSTTVRFGHLTQNYNQLFGSFGYYYNSDGSTFKRFGLYGDSYGEKCMLKPLTFVNGTKDSNVETGDLRVLCDGDCFKFESSFKIATENVSVEIGGHTCLKLFDIPVNDMFTPIVKEKLYRIGKACISVFSTYQPQYFNIAIFVNADNSASIYVVDGSSLYSSMSNGGFDITTLSSLVVV